MCIFEAFLREKFVGLFITNKFQTMIDKNPKVKSGKKDLAESEVLDAVEEICDNYKTFKE